MEDDKVKQQEDSTDQKTVQEQAEEQAKIDKRIDAVYNALGATDVAVAGDQAADAETVLVLKTPNGEIRGTLTDLENQVEANKAQDGAGKQKTEAESLAEANRRQEQEAANGKSLEQRQAETGGV